MIMAITTFEATAHLQEGVRVHTKSRNFELNIDEPKSLGGTDTGMNPVEALLCSLAACQSIVARVYASKFDVPLDDFRVEASGDIDLDGFFDKSDVRRGFSEIRYTFHIKTDAPKENVKQFISYLEKQCPVGDTLANPVPLKLEKIVIEESSNANA